jgi:4-aminobutyrate aminotransferase-like enzyme
MKLKLIDHTTKEHAEKVLKEYYTLETGQMIPQEKKTYLTNLKDSQGPYLGIETGVHGETRYLLDAASQIATLGAGFNSSIFMGTSHFLESWTNNTQSEIVKNIKLSLENFFKRKTGMKDLSLYLGNSGAEANEMALQFCFNERIHEKRTKVLAFEGSFHGRMMTSLSATWNKAKRAPFEWAGYQTVFAPHPLLSDDIFNIENPPELSSLFAQATANDFTVPNKYMEDPILKSEIESLLFVRDELLKDNIFSVMIEPMQCEGGDKYSSSRFHNNLLIMLRSFRVPLIYDEVQTGFHLGRDFFWHRQFSLKDENGVDMHPDYIICAKKAQAGMVIAKKKQELFFEEEFSTASLIRGYHHAMFMDQSSGRIIKLESMVRDELKKLMKNHSDHIESPRCTGVSFAIDLKNKDHIAKLIQERFNHGLLYYPAGERTLRFRLNLAFTEKDVSFLFSQLHNIFNIVFNQKDVTPVMEVDTKDFKTNDLYAIHELFLELKLHILKNGDIDEDKYQKKVLELFKEATGAELSLINHSQFAEYKDMISELQTKTYEETRQTDISSFEKVTQNPNGLALVALKDGKLAGICFASSLKDFPFERGTRRDPYFNNEKCLYVIDTTVSDEFQSSGIGKNLKYALNLLALVKRTQRIHGRNRDKLASYMLNINLSLGSFEQDYISEDYPDHLGHRDVIYYSTPLLWDEESLNQHKLSSGIGSALAPMDLSLEHLKNGLPSINNKVCLSNFVSEKFLKNIKSLFTHLPNDLAHGYIASGQSEAVDKLVKSLWVNNKNHNNLLSFKGHYFGQGSMLSNSLSGHPNSFFEVSILDNPTCENEEDILKQVEELIKKGTYLSVWIEPLQSLSMERTSLTFLKKLRSLCDQYKTPLIFNESASSCFRFSQNQYYASGHPNIMPDAGIQHLGGQAALVFCKSEYFLKDPLMLISTWDGDEFSIENYCAMMNKITEDENQYLKIQNEFHLQLTEKLSQYQITDMNLQHGFGSFKGSLPHSLSKLFKTYNDRYIVCPSRGEMINFSENKGDY